MEYKIVCVDNYYLILEDKVNELLKEGWECLGGVVISPSSCFYQAMIKKI